MTVLVIRKGESRAEGDRSFIQIRLFKTDEKRFVGF